MADRTVLDVFRHDVESPRSDHYSHWTPTGCRTLSTEAFVGRCCGLADALSKMPRYNSHLNVLMHGLGYFKTGLTSREKAQFLDTLSLYREGKVPLSAATSILRSWIARFEVEYLAGQSYFEPFPIDLVEITDSGKGRGK